MRKIFFGLIFLLFICSCEEFRDFLFKEKAIGHRAFGLNGTYVFTHKISDSLSESDTMRFERIHRDDFLVTNFSGTDTIYFGEIVKRRGLYFMNRPSGPKGWWHISAFKFSGDSLYNYWGICSNPAYSEEVHDQKFFSDYDESDTALYINNSSSETYAAMEYAVMHGQRALCREIYPDENGENKIAATETVAQVKCIVYPNPVTDNLIIETKADGKYLVEMIDMGGRTVRSQKFSESFFTMNVASIPNGNYIARISGLPNGQPLNFKIVVKK